MRHVRRALRDLALAKQIPDYEWQVTILYYAAVHTANFAIFGDTPVPDKYVHTMRKRDLLRLWGLSDPAYEAYLMLEGLSRTARYEADAPPMTQASVDAALVLVEEIFRRAGLSFSL